MSDLSYIRSLAILAVVVAMPATVAWTEEHAIIQVSAVLATKSRREIDPRIDANLRNDLRPLPFKGYTLLGIDACRFQTGDKCAMEIPGGGGYLQIETTEATATHLRMRLLLVQETRPILNAEVKLSRNASLLLKSANTGMGTILLRIKAPGSNAADATAVETAANKGR